MSFLVQEESGMELFAQITQTDTVYRYMGGEPENGILSCGYMAKGPSKTQLDFANPYYSCFILLRGKGRYEEPGGLCIPLEPGCVVQRLPGRVHSTVVQCEDWLEFYVIFGKSIFASLQSIGQADDEPVRRGRISPEFPTLFARVLENLRHAGDASLYLSLLEIQRLTHRFLSRQAGGRTDEIEKACSLLREDRTQNLTAPQIAARLCMGYENFRKQFSREIGCSPNAYRMEQRMTTARMMLMGGHSVKQVAYFLGYSDAYTFSKQFKRHNGVPPTAYARVPSVKK